MAPVTEVKRINKKERNVNARKVSIEISNSTNKRHDDEGTLVRLAAWSPVGRNRIQPDDNNTIVVTNGNRHIYGPKALLLKGCVTAHELEKGNHARATFTSLLRPSDHQQCLSVVVSHWDLDTADQMASEIQGSYSAVIDGHQVDCQVVASVGILEGLGTWQTVRDQLEPGNSLLVELGHGTAEEWLIDDTGNIINGQPVEELAIRHVVQKIQQHPSLIALAGTNSRGFSTGLITNALRTGEAPSGRINSDAWRLIIAKEADLYNERLIRYLLVEHEQTLQSTPNLILTGGGAAFQGERLDGFIVPENPQTASVRGAYELLCNGGFDG